MIRLTMLRLDGTKNIRHGTIRLTHDPTIGSVTGIYGPNGTGKTTVIETIRTLRLLMLGAPLDGEQASMLVQRTPDPHEPRQATIHAEFLIDGTPTAYTVVLATDGSGLRPERETITIRKNGARKRTLIDCWMLQNTETGLLTPVTAPAGAWNSLAATAHTGDYLTQEAALAHSQHRSLLFSPGLRDRLTRLSGLLHSQTMLPAARGKALADNLDPLLHTLTRLNSYAEHGIRTVTTRQAASVCFGYTPFMHDGRFDILDIGRPCFVPAGMRMEIDRMIRQANTVLPTVIPGLTLHCDMKDDTDDEGHEGVRVFLYSQHDGTRIPFWAESEGIRRIIGVLSLLVRMFNEPDTLIAVDELDSGIFEILLGDMLRTLANRGLGQLVFTAHNLRVLEVLDRRSIVFSTTDPDDRFVNPTGVHAGNNLRDMYIRAVSMGDGNGLASRTVRSHLAVALMQAGEDAE